MLKLVGIWGFHQELLTGGERNLSQQSFWHCIEGMLQRFPPSPPASAKLGHMGCSGFATASTFGVFNGMFRSRWPPSPRGELEPASLMAFAPPGAMPPAQHQGSALRHIISIHGC